jgi:hypothetical protein
VFSFIQILDGYFDGDHYTATFVGTQGYLSSSSTGTIL